MTTDMTKYLDRRIVNPGQSFFLFGPRGTGKTTWVKHEFPQAHEINLLDESLYQSYLADISRFTDELRGRKEESWVFIDEVQRLPNILNEVHRFIEEAGLKFVLTGSSARKIRRGGVNFLGGRAVFRQLYPFMPAELGSSFDLDTVLSFGSIPLIWNSTNRKASLEAYMQMYLKEEIKAEALVRNLPGFARFLAIAGLMHGQTINISSAARDAEISRTTLSGYIDILEDTLLTFRLPAFESNLRIRERKHPKLYWIDPGIVRAVNRRFTELHPEEKGALFEGWFATLLKAHRDYFGLFDEYYYWAPATATQTEVNFLLQKGRRYLAIEVKTASRSRREDLKGLRAIASLKGMTRRILVYLGDRTMKTGDGIEIWPVYHFLEILDQGALFP